MTNARGHADMRRMMSWDIYFSIFTPVNMELEKLTVEGSINFSLKTGYSYNMFAPFFVIHVYECYHIRHEKRRLFI